MVTKTANLELTEVQDQDVGPGAAASFNNSYDRLDALVQLAVLSASTNAPPIGARQGDRYIVPVGVVGGNAWSLQPRRVAYFSSTGWVFSTPRPGWEAYVQDVDRTYLFKATDWADSGIIIDPTSAKGDLIARTSGGLSRLGVGSNNQVLFADSSAAPGLSWKSLFTTKGQLLGFDGTDVVDLNVGSNGNVLTADSTSSTGWSWKASAGGGALSQIGQIAISTNTPSIAFSALPVGFSNLILVSSARGTDANVQGLQMQLNTDTGGNYNFSFVFSNGASPGSSATYNASSATMGFVEGSTNAADSFGTSRITLYDYLSTAHIKAYSGHGYRRDAGGANAFALTYGGDWNSAAALTDIWLFPAAGDFIAGSVFTLYGEA